MRGGWKALATMHRLGFKFYRLLGLVLRPEAARSRFQLQVDEARNSSITLMTLLRTDAVTAR